MTASEAKKIEQALASFGKDVKAVDQGEGVWKISLPFASSEGTAFYMYAWSRAKQVYLSDARALLRSVKGYGEPQLLVMQGLLESFGLTLMEDFSVMDTTDRPMPVRIMSFLQAWCAVDGIIRVWKISQNNVRASLQRAS